MLSKIILLIALQFAYANGARVLGVVPTPAFSHQLPFRPIWKELSLRGHQVTVITTNPMNDPKLTNLTEIDISSVYEFWNPKMENLTSGKYNGALASILFIFEFITTFADMELQHPKVRELINDKNEHFDVLIVESIVPVMFAFAERFKCPLICMTSVDAPNNVLALVGNPTHPILNQDLLLPYIGEINIFQRVLRVAMDNFYPLLMKLFLPSMNEVIKKNFGNDFADISDLQNNISLIFSNGNIALSPIKPLLPSVIQIGGGIHMHATKPLPADLKLMLDDATDGFIYFSLGSNVKSKDLPSETKQMMLETFSELPYKVLWKFEDETLTKKPKNVFISKWLPQQDVLRHANIKLFISQGGYHSTEEALYSKVPVLGIPFLGDQQYNVNNMVFKGFALRVDESTDIKKDEFKSKILELINNPSYRNKVEELAEIGLDEPMTGLERAVWWTEYVIRHKGAKHLRSPALDLPAYQYYLLDVIGFCLAVITLVTYLFVKLIKLSVKVVKYLFCKKIKND